METFSGQLSDAAQLEILRSQLAHMERVESILEHRRCERRLHMGIVLVIGGTVLALVLARSPLILWLGVPAGQMPEIVRVILERRWRL